MKVVFRMSLYKLRSYNIIRTIMSSSIAQTNAEKVAEELKSNPFYNKYANKIATLQSTSPEEFLNRVTTREQEKLPKETPQTSRQYSSLLEPKKESLGERRVEDEYLNKIMKVELIETKDASEISKIWSDYHINKNFISATIPTKTFEEMNNYAKKYPTFLFPIPRSQGYEFIVSQFFHNTVHFTPLLNYQVHKENAPECLTIFHYTEFKDTKGIILMRGEYDKNVINAQEAQCLANQLQLYYSQGDPVKLQLLEQFTTTPTEFKHMDLVKQIEQLNIVLK